VAHPRSACAYAAYLLVLLRGAESPRASAGSRSRFLVPPAGSSTPQTHASAADTWLLCLLLFVASPALSRLIRSPLSGLGNQCSCIGSSPRFVPNFPRKWRKERSTPVAAHRAHAG